jgi:hypothetical protein
LDPLEVSNRAHSIEGRDLLGVGLDAPLGNYVSQQHASRHSEDALLGVQLYLVGSWAIERHAQVANQVVRLPGFHDYVVYVSLNGPPDVVSEDVLHTSLVRSARISEAKWHRYVAKHSERRDERAGRTLSSLFGGTRSRHQGNTKVHTLQLSQRFDRFVAKEKELWDMLCSN